jgi:hypothetical protein
MPSPELDRLVEIGQLHREPPLRDEYDGLVSNARKRLADARRDDLHAESRFDLAYAAAHALAVAALRRLGYRPANRQIVFHSLAHTLGTPPPVRNLPAKCHTVRNQRDYEGMTGLDDRLVRDLVAAAGDLLRAIEGLTPPGRG